MIKKIPKEILQKYKTNSTYIRLRWRLCPFELIESLVPEEGTIVDIGCGCGILANLMHLKHKERKIIGIDSSAKRIAIAKESNSEINFLLSQADNLEIKRFDAAVMSDFLHHIEYKTQIKLLKKIYQRINKNGILLIQEICYRPFWKYIAVWFADHILNPGKRAYYRKAEEMASLLSKTGFHVEIIKADKDLPLSDIIYLCRKL
jgi:2-polyprenyl-3-methyl-5-hydroxy-6-metoxy-1,4-benzoquinol methylase